MVHRSLERPEGEARTTIEPSLPPRALRVLVVDDSESQRRAVRQELSDMNVEVFEATSGIVALQKAHQIAIDLVTLDIEMSDFDGYRVLRQLRARERTRATKVIMISGRPNESERFRAEQEGAVAYFAKPFAPGTLRALVDDILTRVSNHRKTRVAGLVAEGDLGDNLSRMVSAQGYRYSGVADVAELARSTTPCQVLLLDLDLPKQGAYRALDELRGLAEHQRPHVLGVLSHFVPADLAHAFDRGLSDFVRVPFHPEELIARIEHLVSLRREADALRDLGTTDALTGLPNRAHLERDAARVQGEAMRAGSDVGVVMVDVDHFKRLNDTYGHPFGDVVLREVGRCLRQCLRGNDLVGRYGGEEFLLLVPNATPEGMQIVAERLRSGVEAIALEHGGAPVRVTASLGTCIWSARALGAAASLGELVEPADAALYEAKRSGRNRACFGPMVNAHPRVSSGSV